MISKYFYFTLTLLLLPCIFSSIPTSKVNYHDLLTWSQQCNLGRSQSPIDLRPNQSIQYCDFNKISIGFMDGEIKLRVQPDSQFMEMRHFNSIVSVVDYDQTILEYLGDSMTVHVPSEHTLEGHHADLQLQLNHQIFSDIPNNLATSYNRCTVSLLFNITPTTTNPTIFQHLPTTTTAATTLNFATVFKDLIHGQNFFHYHGSSTTPPCKENVNWYVMQKVLEVTQEQYDNIKEMLKGEENNRPVQEGNARTVYLVNQQCNVRIEMTTLGRYNGGGSRVSKGIIVGVMVMMMVIVMI